jgi:predicted transcriptional regulator
MTNIKNPAMKYRSRTDIISQVLRVAAQGATKTRIMYSAFLSHDQLKEYLTILDHNGLLEYDEETRKYHTTNKGRRLMQICDQMQFWLRTAPATS